MDRSSRRRREKLRRSKNSSQHVDEEAETTATFCGESVPVAAAVALRAKHGTRLEVALAADEGREEALSLSRRDHAGRIRGGDRPVAREKEAGVRPSRAVVKDVAEIPGSTGTWSSRRVAEAAGEQRRYWRAAHAERGGAEAASRRSNVARATSE